MNKFEKFAQIQYPTIKIILQLFSILYLLTNMEGETVKSWFILPILWLRVQRWNGAKKTKTCGNLEWNITHFLSFNDHTFLYKVINVKPKNLTSSEKKDLEDAKMKSKWILERRIPFRHITDDHKETFKDLLSKPYKDSMAMLSTNIEKIENTFKKTPSRRKPWGSQLLCWLSSI